MAMPADLISLRCLISVKKIISAMRWLCFEAQDGPIESEFVRESDGMAVANPRRHPWEIRRSSSGSHRARQPSSNRRRSEYARRLVCKNHRRGKKRPGCLYRPSNNSLQDPWPRGLVGRALRSKRIHPPSSEEKNRRVQRTTAAVRPARRISWLSTCLEVVLRVRRQAGLRKASRARRLVRFLRRDAYQAFPLLV